MEKIVENLEISIQRSDGSISEAKISSVNYEEQIVKVVFNGKNNKHHSKDVTFSEVMRLNPRIAKRDNLATTSSQIKGFRRTLGRTGNKTSYSTQVLEGKEGRKSVASSVVCETKDTETSRMVNNLPAITDGEYEAVVEHVLRQDVPKSHTNYLYNKMMLEQEKNLVYGKLEYNESIYSEKKMHVYIRVRPLNSSEKRRKEISAVAVPNNNRIVLFTPQVKLNLEKFISSQSFTFDGVFNENATTENLYRVACRQLLSTFLGGECATCFAYGQTGSGKTFTMHGKSGRSKSPGIYDLMSSDVFEGFRRCLLAKKGYTIKCAFFEIYMNKAYDLLDNRKELRVQADGNNRVQIPNLTQHVCKSPLDVSGILQQGSLLRSLGKTKSNKESSRSHAIFQFILSHDDKAISRLSLVDLAGNERGIDAGNVDRITRNEGNAINTSLLALKECIRHMSTGIVDRIPFRNSALTQFLKDSFIGANSKLCMITTISPATSSCEATHNSLKYSDQVIQINLRESILPSQLTLPTFKDCKEVETANEIASLKENEVDDDDDTVEIQSIKSIFLKAIRELDEMDSLLQTTSGKENVGKKLKLLKERFNIM